MGKGFERIHRFPKSAGRSVAAEQAGRRIAAAMSPQHSAHLSIFEPFIENTYESDNIVDSAGA